jgi:hypothetical protein
MAFPYDQSFKLLSEEDAVGSLKLLAGIPLSAEAEIESLDRELNPERLHADHLYLVRDRGKECIHHFEALASYRAGWEGAQIDHAIHVGMKYRLPVFSHLLLLHQRGTPRVIPDRIVRTLGSLRLSLRVNIIRTWRRPAHEVLNANRIALYPWITLMEASVEQQREAARRIRESGREGLLMQMVLLGAFRYGNREAFIERIGRMLLTKELLRESPAWKEIVQEGKVEGIFEGRAEGELLGQRKALRRFLQTRFGPLPEWAEQKVEGAGSDMLELWTERAATAATLAGTLD